MTIHASRYVNICLPHVFNNVLEWRKSTSIRGLISHHSNVGLNRIWINNEFLIENRVESYINPLYYPELSLCDLYLFPKVKKSTTWNSVRRWHCNFGYIRTTDHHPDKE